MICCLFTTAFCIEQRVPILAKLGHVMCIQFIGVSWGLSVIIITNCCLNQYRKYVAALIDFPAAFYIFCAILYFSRSWQNLHFVVAAACASALPLLFFVIPESPRWLILNNRKEEAITILLKVNNQNMARTFY